VVFPSVPTSIVCILFLFIVIRVFSLGLFYILCVRRSPCAGCPRGSHMAGLVSVMGTCAAFHCLFAFLRFQCHLLSAIPGAASHLRDGPFSVGRHLRHDVFVCGLWLRPFRSFSPCSLFLRHSSLGCSFYRPPCHLLASHLRDPVFGKGVFVAPLAGIIHPYRTFLPDSSSAQPHLRGQPLSLLVPAGDKYLYSPTCGGCSSVGIRGVPGVWWGLLWFGILWAGLGGTVLMGDRVIFPDPHCLLYGRLCLCPLPGAFSRGGVSVRLILWLVSFPALPSLLSVPPYRCARVFRARCLFPDTFVGSCSGPSLFPPA